MPIRNTDYRELVKETNQGPTFFGPLTARSCTSVELYVFLLAVFPDCHDLLLGDFVSAFFPLPFDAFCDDPVCDFALFELRLQIKSLPPMAFLLEYFDFDAFVQMGSPPSVGGSVGGTFVVPPSVASAVGNTLGPTDG